MNTISSLTLLFLIFHDPRWLCLSWIFAAICFTAAFNCLILSTAQTIQFSSMEETFNAIEWVLVSSSCAGQHTELTFML
jgi:hypothetical protein